MQKTGDTADSGCANILHLWLFVCFRCMFCMFLHFFMRVYTYLCAFVNRFFVQIFQNQCYVWARDSLPSVDTYLNYFVLKTLRGWVGTAPEVLSSLKKIETSI